MSMKVLKTLTLAGLLAMAAIPMSAGAEGKASPPAFQIEMNGAYGAPNMNTSDGIILGGSCTPDYHTFDLEGPPIVFAVNVVPKEKNPKAVNTFSVDLENVNVKVVIFDSSGDKLTSAPLELETKEDGSKFFVACLPPSAIGLSPGDYTYQFEASPKNGNPVRKWVPNNNTFTITDNSPAK